MDVDMDIFGHDDVTDSKSDDDLDKQAFNAFKRLQLARKKLSSINNVMVAMKAELSAIFNWVDITTDTLNSNKLDKKTVKELQGSLYTPACQSGKTVVVLPQSITHLNLKTIERSVSRLTDILPKGQGQTLYRSLIDSLGTTQWLK